MSLNLALRLGARQAAAGGSKSYAFLQGTTSTADLTTYTFASQNLGSAAAGRYIIACVFARKGSAISVSSVDIGGVSATELGQQQTATPDGVVGMYIANVPTGTTGDVVVTFNTGALRATLSLYSALGVTTTPNDVDTSNAAAPSVTLSVVAGGFAVGCGMSGSAGGVSDTASWSNLTEDFDTEMEARAVVTSASASTPSTGSLSPTVTFTDPTLTAGVFASW